MAMVNQLPSGAIFSAFSIGRMQLPFVAMAVLAGGNVRVGLEDNIYLVARNPGGERELVERAVRILDAMNVRILGPDDVREQLQLARVKRANGPSSRERRSMSERTARAGGAAGTGRR